jgi:hypothetical protein
VNAAINDSTAMGMPGGAVGVAGRFFYVWMATIFFLIAVGGFIPSYWARIATGDFDRPPIFHIHAVLLFGWTAFFLVQTVLAAAGRRLDHRRWGMAGIALFSLMMCSIVALAIIAMRAAEEAGAGEAGRRFAAVTFLSWLLLAVLFALAMANLRKPQTHKRLMVLMMVALVCPAIARVFAVLFAAHVAPGPPPLAATIAPGVVADLLILVALIHDWRTLGRPHPAYVYGGLLILLEQGLQGPIGNSAAWQSVAKYLQTMAG